MVRIRRAVSEDAPRLVEIYGYYVEKTAISFEYTVPSPEEFRGRMEDVYKRQALRHSSSTMTDTKIRAHSFRFVTASPPSASLYAPGLRGLPGFGLSIPGQASFLFPGHRICKRNGAGVRADRVVRAYGSVSCGV